MPSDSCLDVVFTAIAELADGSRLLHLALGPRRDGNSILVALEALANLEQCDIVCRFTVHYVPYWFAELTDEAKGPDECAYIFEELKDHEVGYTEEGNLPKSTDVYIPANPESKPLAKEMN